ncbi:MAG: hypothetical protein M3308_02290 [Actinomycetota bacterium]|nr:hypothetical protein [Actinomycetota bacterium]
MSWADGAGLDDRTWTRERRGAPREPLDDAGWPADQKLYRPFLSYGELGALLDGSPVELHEALHRLLGLGDIEVARDRLKSARTERDRRVKALREAKTDLLTDLGALDDPRARRVEQEFGSRTPDLASLPNSLGGTIAMPSRSPDFAASRRCLYPERTRS